MNIIQNSEAKQIGREQTDTVLESLRIVAEALKALFEKLRGLGLGKKDENLEIRLGRKVLFRGRAGEPPQINRLTPENIAFVRAATRLPEVQKSERAGANIEANGKTDLTIKSGRETVFQMKDGEVFRNRIGGIEELVSDQKEGQQPGSEQPQRFRPALEVVRSQVERQMPEGADKRAVSALFGELGADALARAADDRSVRSAIAKRVLDVERSLKGTALANRPEGFSIGAGANTYQVSVEENRYSLKDNRGQEVMRFERGIFGPRNIESRMTVTQQLDFLPPDGKLAGQALNTASVREWQALRSIENAREVVSQLGTTSPLGNRAYDGTQYRIEQRGEDLTIQAKDGRGELLSLRGGTLTSTMEPADYERFAQVGEEAKERLARGTLVAQAAEAIVERFGSEGLFARRFEGNQYEIEKQGDRLNLYARDGRGLLLQRDGERITHSEVSERDLANLQRAGAVLSGREQQRSTEWQR